MGRIYDAERAPFRFNLDIADGSVYVPSIYDTLISFELELGLGFREPPLCLPIIADD